MNGMLSYNPACDFKYDQFTSLQNSSILSQTFFMKIIKMVKINFDDYHKDFRSHLIAIKLVDPGKPM